MIIILELLFGAKKSSLYGQAVGLNIANHLGAIPTRPFICDILIPTSMRRFGVMGGRHISKYILPLPTCPPKSPLSVLEKCGIATKSAARALTLTNRAKRLNSTTRFIFLDFFV